MLTYAAQTWTVRVNNYKQLETTQRATMIRSILGTRRIDKIKIETKNKNAEYYDPYKTNEIEMDRAHYEIDRREMDKENYRMESYK